eukprot:403337329
MLSLINTLSNEGGGSGNIFRQDDLKKPPKVLEPYCGPKTRDIRYCDNDYDCRYSDEFCKYEAEEDQTDEEVDQSTVSGICTTDLSLYENYTCPENV